MPVRQLYAQKFYSGDCKVKIDNFLKQYKLPKEPQTILAGIVPHAGWPYSGAVAAKVFKTISIKTNPSIFILLGAVHYPWRVRNNSIYTRGSWATPLGEIEVDDEIADVLLDSLKGQIIDDPQAHEGEHSLEVQAPFIKYLFPKAKIVPLAVLPDKNAHAIGRKIGEIVLQSNKKIVVVGTTDFTHYGDDYDFTPYGYGQEAKKQMQENDFRIIELAVHMNSPEIVEEARRNRSACGAGALAATVSAVKTMGANQGYLLEYTTSYDVMREGAFEMAVGYAGIVF